MTRWRRAKADDDLCVISIQMMYQAKMPLEVVSPADFDSTLGLRASNDLAILRRLCTLMYGFLVPKQISAETKWLDIAVLTAEPAVMHRVLVLSSPLSAVLRGGERGVTYLSLLIVQNDLSHRSH